jgi:hypothetical protein
LSITHFFDHTDAATFLAQKYCQQLFDNAEGRDVLRRFKEYSQHYVTSVHTDSSGVIDAKAPRIDHFVRARSGPKQKLESDTDQLIESRSNKALLSGISFKKNQIIEIEITPAGRAYVRPYKLQTDVSSKE